MSNIFRVGITTHISLRLRVLCIGSPHNRLQLVGLTHSAAVNHVVVKGRCIRLYAWVVKRRNLSLAFWRRVIMVNVVDTITLTTFFPVGAGRALQRAVFYISQI